ncbi:probable pyridoxal 5'-phosphate synthase subunit PDX1.1 [Oryza glaberrima]|uniref:probable pyridoxal 5'-phosphate synthase subunit PDX1.1 n=1 Tax=Oryza glaberrima TaxID=4538 RepID=UPI00023DFC67|nr:probable pyridoxal 5'-phosphate synthase subunit PDX1.1 [Oryza glaberrima]
MSSPRQPPPCRTILTVNRAAQTTPITPPQARSTGWRPPTAMERIPADIRVQGGVAQMSDPVLIRDIKHVVTILVMAKAHIGHFVEAQILEDIGEAQLRILFICGCRDLGEALRRIRNGTTIIHNKDEAGTESAHSVMGQIRALRNTDDDEVFTYAKRNAAPYDLVM